MTTKASFSFSLPNTADAQLVIAALDPEIQNSIPKTNITLNSEKNTLFLTIESADTSTLRAACNSYLRWIQTALTVQELI